MPAITLDDLRFSYPPPVPGTPPVDLLRGITLSIPPGQAVALMGATSSGKSTLALILAGLCPEMTGGTLRGQVTVNGLDVAGTPAAELSASLGLVFQEPERQLFNMTVAEEVAFGLEGQAMPPGEIGPRVAWALAQVGLGGLEKRSPWQLSGGQQKRLAIATVLAMQPPILLLDGPMAGLDPAARREVAAVLSDLRRVGGTTVLVMEKDAEFVARWAERVVVLAGGQIELDGPPQSVFAEVDRLDRLGVAVPQMAELAARLHQGGRFVAFLTAQGAAQALLPCLDARPAPPPATRAASARRGPGDGTSSLVPGARLTAHHRVPIAHHAPLAIDVRDVSFRYPDGTQALDRLTLAVPSGQFLALVGPNGGGKSTLARHLNGLLRPQAGTVAIHGRPAENRPVGELARQVGYVFQNPDHQIFAASVQEEVAYGPRVLDIGKDELRERVAGALQAFDLGPVAGVPPAVLGYGLRRLVTLASVWALQPSIWVLDEPTTGLDARLTALLLDRLRSLHAAGHTILLITHDLKLAAAAAQRVAVVHRGQVVLDGTPAAVLGDGQALSAFGLRPPPIVRLSALLAPHGFPHPTLTVDQFMATWERMGAADWTTD